MILHDASSGTIAHGVSLCLRHHCHPGNIVILLWLTHSPQNFAQHVRPFAGTVHSGMVLYPSVVIGEFGGVPLRENVPGSPARTRSRIEVFLKTVSIMMVHNCSINGDAMVLFRPFSLQLSCSFV